MVELQDLIEQVGEEKARAILEKYLEQEHHEDEDILTIVVNKGVHHLPEEKLRGSVFYASEGNLDFSSIDSVQEEFEKILEDLTRILKSRSWKKVFILPFGPSVLSMQIKLLVYRITRIESIELFYLGESEYIDLEIKQRNIIVGTE